MGGTAIALAFIYSLLVNSSGSRRTRYNVSGSSMARTAGREASIGITEQHVLYEASHAEVARRPPGGVTE